MFRSVRNFILQYVLPALVALGIIMAGETWPQYKDWFWIGFWVLLVAGLVIFVYRVADEPVNYKSIHVTPDHIEYKVSIDHHIIPFKEILSVEYVREQATFDDLYGPYLETKWMLKTAAGKYIEVMDEWPDRRKLLRAFKTFLPGFNDKAARQGIRAREKGRWPCFQKDR